MNRLAPITFAAMSMMLAACSDEKKEAPAPVRPVLSIIAAPRETVAAGFTGTVEAKFTTDLGFQVLGRITARRVNVGDLVHRGDVLATIDVTALQLGVNQADADLASAKAKADLARTTEQRQKTLLSSNAATREQFEEAVQSREAAEATVQRLQASLTKAREQLGYGELKAQSDGVVSAISAEVGQVVAAGQTVATIARLEARDAVVDIPDSYDGLTAAGTPFIVTLQANPDSKIKGTLRETTPQSDAATRTRRTKIALDAPPDTFRLGSMVTASPDQPSNGHLWLPASAINSNEGQSFVWVVDTGKKTVGRRQVSVRPSATGGVDVLDGLEAGTRVVTAGVHSLSEHQPVTLPDEMSR